MKMCRLNNYSVFIVSVCLLSSVTEVTLLQELRILQMISNTGIAYKSFGSCYPSIVMAMEDVRQHEDMLNGYNLVYSWADSKCDAGTALFEMFQHLGKDPPYHLLLGPTCSISGEATAQVSFMWNLTQLSCETSSPILSDRKRFPMFFRSTNSDHLLNSARVALLQEFNWNRVATVHQAREFFAAITDDLVQRLEHTNITIISQEIFANDPFARVDNLMRHDARIILTAMYEDKALELLCAAYKRGLYGPKIVWIFLGWYTTTFWQHNIQHIDCTKEEMAQAAEGAFLTGVLHYNPIEERGIYNMTVSEFEYRYYNHPLYDPMWKDSERITSYLCYDLIWTAALALNCTIGVLAQIGHPKTLDQFTYNDGDIGDVIFKCMENVTLIGVSGKTSFKKGPDSVGKVKLIQRIQGDKRVRIALYRQDKDPSYFEWNEGALKWKNGIIPADSAHIKNEEVRLPLILYIPMVTLAVIGIGLSLSFLVFNIIYRKNRFVKMSSPNINNLLLLGCVLCYSTVIFKTIGHDSSTICRGRTYCFSLGFTLTFGSLFTKTWRVYRIFLNKGIRVHIKDSQLFIVIGLLVAVILASLVMSDIIGPQMIQQKFLLKEVYETSDGTEIRPFVRICWSNYSSYFSWILYIIQGALLTFGTFLAYETRHVTVKELNDSQKIGMCLYNVVTLSAVGVLLSLLLDDEEVLLYGLSSGFIIVGTTVTQFLIFVPKVRGVINKIDVDHISTLPDRAGLGAQSSLSGNSHNANLSTVSTTSQAQ